MASDAIGYDEKVSLRRADLHFGLLHAGLQHSQRPRKDGDQKLIFIRGPFSPRIGLSVRAEAQGPSSF
jgi:hypothetical protein